MKTMDEFAERRYQENAARMIEAVRSLLEAWWAGEPTEPGLQGLQEAAIRMADGLDLDQLKMGKLASRRIKNHTTIHPSPVDAAQIVHSITESRRCRDDEGTTE